MKGSHALRRALHSLGEQPFLHLVTVGMIAYSLLLLMMITSFNGPTRALGPKRWRILHKTGLYWFGLLFLATLLPSDRNLLFAPERLGLYALTAAAIFIRLTAFFASRKKGST